MIRYDIYDFNREVLHILCGFNFAVYRKHLYLFGGRLFFFFCRLTLLSQNRLRVIIKTL